MFILPRFESLALFGLIEGVWSLIVVGRTARILGLRAIERHFGGTAFWATHLILQMGCSVRDGLSWP